MAQLSIMLEYARQHSPIPISALFILVITIACLFRLYLLALPKPIPGIPYNKDSANKLFGDGQAYLEHFKNGGTFATYCQSVVKSLDAPLIQIFIKPFKQPLLVLADFRETQALMCRNDFDRSDDMADMILGLMPEHHMGMKTDAVWKAQRLLIKDLMLPSWLHSVAAPEIYQHALSLVELWALKSRLADGRAFEASENLRRMTMDAVMSFCFGKRFRDTATRPDIEALKSKSLDIIMPDDPEEPVKFPHAALSLVLKSLDTLFSLIAEIQGSPKPSWTWSYILQKPRNARALRLRDAYILAEIKYAVEQLKESRSDDTGKSAVQYMVLREKSLAEKEGREPQYLSKVMMDEVCGFVFAGTDTTSTAMSWGVKLLTDNPRVAACLRTALRESFADAVVDGRNPTVEEIVGTHVPYLEATLEEIHRCGGTTPIVDRQATIDTELLGHRIPKKTNVACLTMGPSMMEPSFNIDEAHRHESIRGMQGEKWKQWDVNDMALFKPERWIRDNRFDPGAGPQLAFGLGVRACYGKRLAYLNMRILFALLVWNFELLPCPKRLSDYSSKLVATNRPNTCYVCLQEIGSSS
ncbi:cytochrome P450 monooxygenase [Corynascus novoguineensis]|uniref:Cytochrome P450 monooxygenase n=1 Tax=Corynascus novoguineensis TaxID=1126955 RepID=A0AAN7HIL6_9PEZI|nr:cytochrome P450 monooxygenase [Corynascus novoguineensis]